MDLLTLDSTTVAFDNRLLWLLVAVPETWTLTQLKLCNELVLYAHRKWALSVEAILQWKTTIAVASEVEKVMSWYLIALQEHSLSNIRTLVCMHCLVRKDSYCKYTHSVNWLDMYVILISNCYELWEDRTHTCSLYCINVSHRYVITKSITIQCCE